MITALFRHQLTTTSTLASLSVRQLKRFPLRFCSSAPRPVRRNINSRKYTQFRKCLLTGCCSSLAVLLGWTLKLSADSFQLALVSPVLAQSSEPITTAEIERYARAALMIEDARRQLIDEIGESRILGISCEDAAQINDLEEVILNSCEKFEQFVERNNLSNARFNQIHLQQAEDSTLARNILAEMARICLETNDTLSPSFCQESVRVQMQRECEAQSDLITNELCDRLRGEN